MSELILYAAYCINCKNRRELSILQLFAKEHELHLVTRRTDIVKEYREEANNISTLSAPFVYNPVNLKSVRLVDLTLDKLEELL